MRALITGASGFCAKHLADRLRADGSVRIAGADIAGHAPKDVAAADIAIDEYHRADVSDMDQMAALVDELQPDMLFHLAGTALGSSASAQASPRNAFLVNTMGAVNVLEAVRLNAPGCRVLLVGSAAEYGFVPQLELPASEERICRPVGAYGASKLAATLAGREYAHKFGLKVVMARPFNIIGPGMPLDLVVGALAFRAKKALAGSADAIVTAGDLSPQRDFIAVEDVVRAYVQLLQGDCWGEVFNICSGQPHSIQHVAEVLFSHSPRRITLQTDPSLAQSSVRSMYGSFEKANRAIAFTPNVSLESSLAAVWSAAMAA
jgi:GDP-4-dehydro-6-deoxy-D-mannose reductase